MNGQVGCLLGRTLVPVCLALLFLPVTSQVLEMHAPCPPSPITGYQAKVPGSACLFSIHVYKDSWMLQILFLDIAGWLSICFGFIARKHSFMQHWQLKLLYVSVILAVSTEIKYS